MQFLVSVTGEVDHTYTVEAEDAFDARDIAELKFCTEFTAAFGGHGVGFNSVFAYDAEEA